MSEHCGNDETIGTSLEFSKGSLNRLIIEEKYLQKKLKEVQNDKAHCQANIKILEEHINKENK